jgi:cardiolipin synthase
MSAKTARLLLTIANLLSVGRLCATPVVILFLVRAETAPEYNHYALILLISLQASDVLDGFLARSAMRSGANANPFGQMLDPVADKFYINAAYLTLAVCSRIAVWLAVVILARDVLIISGWLLRYYRSGIRTPPNVLGKVADASQAFLLFAILLDVPHLDWGILLVVSLTVLSGIFYAKKLLPSAPAAPGS